MTARHEFFEGEICKALRLELDAPSAALANRAGLVVRTAPGTLVVLYDTDRRGVLDAFAAEGDPPFRLVIRAMAVDPRFSTYSEPSPPSHGKVLIFHSDHATPDAARGTQRLSREATASAKDLVPTDDPAVGEMLSRHDLLRPPTALIVLRMADDDGRLVDPTPTGRRFTLDFQARRTYWRYLVLGALRQRAASIVDLDGSIEFESTGETTLPGNRMALSFRSRTPIPLRERSDRRFQLRENGANGSNGGRLVVKRLPVAVPDQLSRVTIDGEETFVSDIYLNG